MSPWDFTLLVLTGQPLPPLPAIPGQVHHLTGDDLPLPETERDELLLSDATDAEVGTVLGVTRQRANQIRQALRERLTNPERTEP